MNSIIFDTAVDGHHLEYLNHIYLLCATRIDNRYVFVIPETFNKVKEQLQWPAAPNISFDFISEEEMCLYYRTSGYYKRQKLLSSIINNRCKVHNIYNVFTNGLLTLIPFAPLFLNHSVRLSGIIYDIYDYQQQNHHSLKSKLPLWLSYQIVSHWPTYNKIFLLNDENAPNRLNNRFHTSKFVYLPDPYIPLPNPSEDICKTFGIPANHKIYAHIGSLSRRKGTLVCLDAINRLSDIELSKCTFIFAGHLGRFETEFNERLSKINPKANIIVRNEFCSYDFFSAICSAADYLLMPYLETIRSSGIIGYSAQFCKPVIGPSDGLMGKLIKEYKLGLQLYKCDVFSLENMLKQTIKSSKTATKSTYCSKHTIELFQKTLEVIL